MKKLVITILVVVLLPVWGVNAAPGEAAGNIYTTDIVTSIFGVPVTSYNIGGKTCIDAEILNWHYGFDVYWHGDTRRLEVNDWGNRFLSLQALSGELVENKSEQPGKVAGNYYETDIKTTLNGKEIESYNIGGRTMICAEAMRDFGYDVIWNQEARTLSIFRPMDFYTYASEFGTVRSGESLDVVRKTQMFFNRGVIVTKGDKQYMLDVPSGQIFASPGGTTHMKLTDLAQLLNGKCTMTESVGTHEVMWQNGEGQTHDYYKYNMDISFDGIPELELKEYDPNTYEITRTELDGEKYKFIDFGMCSTLSLNGEPFEIKGMNGGKVFKSGMDIIGGEVYIPIYNLVELFGYDWAW